MNNNLNLRIRIVQKYGNQKTFADALGTSEQYVSAKLCGRNAITAKDLWKWGRMLDIPETEFKEYFPAFFKALDGERI